MKHEEHANKMIDTRMMNIKKYDNDEHGKHQHDDTAEMYEHKYNNEIAENYEK